MSRNLQETIVALSTPPGTSALAVIRLSGVDAISITDQIIPELKLHQKKSHTVHFGKIKKNKQVIDEVVIALFRSPTSYTGEDVVEISTHGSPYIVKKVMELLIETGARAATAGEFTLRAFLNQKLDLTQAEAVADLIHSENEKAHQLAINQLKGGIKNKISSLRTKLLDFVSLIELELDFGEEDVEFARRDDLLVLLNKISSELTALKDSFSLGNAIHHGISTVIAGKPNAGKSTLLNALLDDERAIVSCIAGTTRDTIEEQLTISGIQFKLIDTAGIREAQDEIEQIGVERSIKKINESSLILYVVDVCSMSKEEVWEETKKLIHEKSTLLLVLNKMDMYRVLDYHDFVCEHIPIHNIVPLSAKNKMNIEYLKEKMLSLSLGELQHADQTIITNSRHYESLVNCLESIQRVIQGIQSHLPTDFIAQDLRRSLYELGLISGEFSTDEILGNIFGKFCIGK